VEYFTPAIEDRAIEVQAILAERGQHRTPSIPDLLIAEVTAQPIERLSQP
jgi:predicted nucleic acid-binding protein